ncbi:ATP-binding cassette domain-containing protein [Nitriliruptoraceae bacterium ZYF776]|nr:ATP-binding cassette domain-containing protein [Profundirhabdus halotolerans]
MVAPPRGPRAGRRGPCRDTTATDDEEDRVIEVAGLTKRYGDDTAVDDVSFRCAPGRVTGFLGPNGAGKTTTLRALVGLTTPTAGTATVGGHRYVDLPNPGRHVGVLLDAAAQHGGRTGREILTLGALQLGMPLTRVDELLATVSLSDHEASRHLRHYSLGMRQRLGLAHALLGDPAVLILDEPANGLDPAGIRWMRTLLADHAGRGGTVLLSSHLLHEVELVADDLVVIGHGRIVAAGDRRSLLDDTAAVAGVTEVGSLDDAALAEAAGAAGFEVVPTGDGLRIAAPSVEVGRLAAERGIVLTRLGHTSSGLEDRFLELTAASQRDATTTGGPS